jgi:transcriptional regulator CtsR
MIKVFRFRISNHHLVISKQIGLKENEISQNIEETINSFLEDKKLLSLQVSTVMVNQPKKDAVANTVDMVYTIVYDHYKLNEDFE